MALRPAGACRAARGRGLRRGQDPPAPRLPHTRVCVCAREICPCKPPRVRERDLPSGPVCVCVCLSVLCPQDLCMCV